MPPFQPTSTMTTRQMWHARLAHCKKHAKKARECEDRSRHFPITFNEQDSPKVTHEGLLHSRKCSTEISSTLSGINTNCSNAHHHHIRINPLQPELLGLCTPKRSRYTSTFWWPLSYAISSDVSLILGHDIPHLLQTQPAPTGGSTDYYRSDYERVFASLRRFLTPCLCDDSLMIALWKWHSIRSVWSQLLAVWDAS